MVRHLANTSNQLGSVFKNRHGQDQALLQSAAISNQHIKILKLRAHCEMWIDVTSSNKMTCGLGRLVLCRRRLKCASESWFPLGIFPPLFSWLSLCFCALSLISLCPFLFLFLLPSFPPPTFFLPSFLSLSFLSFCLSFHRTNCYCLFYFLITNNWLLSCKPVRVHKIPSHQE